VDAILGAPSQMHAILTDYCIGCRLCLPPCPTQCITIVEAPSLAPEARKTRAKVAKQRHQAQKERLERQVDRKAQADHHATHDIKAQLAATLARHKQKA